MTSTIRRPYFFELFIAANFLLIVYLGEREKFAVLRTFPASALATGAAFLLYIVVGVVGRLLVASLRGEGRRYLSAISNSSWALDTLRISAGGVVLIHTYAWIKLTVPHFHPRLFDQELWNLDQVLLFGFSPNVLFLEVFSAKWTLWFIDWSYAKIFFTSMLLTFAFFMSEPHRRIRVAFMSGNALLWIIGAWLYLLIPSLGPVFRFPDLWLRYAEDLKISGYFQVLLMRNYQNVLALPTDPRRPVAIILGIAAFPSLHVAFQTFVFLWMRRLWTSGQVIFGVFALVILLGSVVTGWHYLVDGYAGIALAAIMYLTTATVYRVPRALRLRRAVARAQN